MDIYSKPKSIACVGTQSGWCIGNRRSGGSGLKLRSVLMSNAHRETATAHSQKITQICNENPFFINHTPVPIPASKSSKDLFEAKIMDSKYVSFASKVNN